MALPVFDISVQGLTFEDLLDDFRELSKKFIPDWDFTNPNDPVVYMTELYLNGLDRESFFANLLAQEFALDTALDRRSIYSHAKRLGYVPATRQPAQVEVTLEVVPSPILRTIVAYTARVGTAAAGDEESVPFENREDIIIPVDATSVVASFSHGQTSADSFTSTGRPYQKFGLTRIPVLLEEAIPESISVEVDGNPWTRIDGFGDAGPTDEVYVLDLDFDGAGFILFGDSARGEIPPVGGAISVVYRVGGGTIGNVAQDSISTLLSTPSYVTGVSNLNAATGGTEEESPEHIKIYAPIAIREGGQLNTLDSIAEYLESLVPIARAKTFLFATEVRAVALVEPGFVLDDVRTSIENDVLERLVMGFQFILVPPTFKEVDVNVRVFAQRGSDRQLVFDQTAEAIATWLDPLATDDDGNFINSFGEALLISDLGFLLKTIPRVFDFEIFDPIENVLLDDNQLSTPNHVDTTLNIEVILEGDVGFTNARLLGRRV